jgi:tetratricopeptide (TPR) repeat protein
MAVSPSCGARCGIVMVGLLILSGCVSDQIKTMQAQIAQQQQELDQNKQQIAALQAQSSATQVSPVAPNGCDEDVMHEASRKGGERFAASDFQDALAYYQDAAIACPKNSRAQLNLARTYESIGETTQAREHYQLAAASSDDSDGAAKEAHDALARLSH